MQFPSLKCSYKQYCHHHHYDAIVQAVYCSFPEERTQPVSEHKLKKEKDIVGRFSVFILISHHICPHHDESDHDDYREDEIQGAGSGGGDCPPGPTYTCLPGNHHHHHHHQHKHQHHTCLTSSCYSPSYH